jgi:hypothetical protein
LNFFGLFFVEFGATNESIGFGVIGGFFVLGFGEFMGDGGSLVFAQVRFATDRRNQGRG